MGQRVAPILDEDLDRVSSFLHRHVNPGITREDWRRSFTVSRRFSPANHGMMLLDHEEVVGAYAAYYSERAVAGRTERFCNLGAWCVLPDHRIHAVRLLQRLLAQPGHHFSDLSPSGNVVEINRRLGFEFLDSRSVLVPTAPYPRRQGSITGDPHEIEVALDAADRARWTDHAGVRPARHALLRDGARTCWVVFRIDRRTTATGLVASILHVGDREVFHDLLRPFLGHLLMRHGAVAMLAELRVIGRRPAGALTLTSFRRKMYRSTGLAPADVDYFYSELVAVPW